MSWPSKIKYYLTLVTIASFFIAGGVEYSVIIPTCWNYMHDNFGAEKWLYGLTLAAMSISNFIMGPLMGALYDRTHEPKYIMLFLNLFEIGGNFMYFAASSKYMILASRFLTGLGWSAGAVVYGHLARVSPKSRRTAVYSVMMSLRQFGVILGPGFNLIYRTFNFHLGSYRVDKYTAPGLFMMLVWTVIEIMFLFFFFELPPLGELELKRENENHQKQTTLHTSQSQTDNAMNTPGQYRHVFINDDTHTVMSNSDLLPNNESSPLLHSTKDMFTSSSGTSVLSLNNNEEKETITEGEKETITEGEKGTIGEGERRTLRGSDNNTDKEGARLKSEAEGTYRGQETARAYGTFASVSREGVRLSSTDTIKCVICSDVFVYLGMKLKRLGWLISELIREEIVVLLALLFFTLFDELVLETGLVPMAEALLNWTDFETGIFFSSQSTVNIICLLIVLFLSQKVKIPDRYMIYFGIFLEFFAITWLMGFFGSGSATSTRIWAIAEFSFGLCLVIVALSFSWVTSNSLYSKLLPMSVQGFGQGVRRSVESLAAIMGPLWAGAAFEFSTTYYPFYGVQIGVLLMVMVLMILSFKKLKYTSNNLR